MRACVCHAGVCWSHDVERSPDTDEQRHQRTRESDATAAADAENRETTTSTSLGLVHDNEPLPGRGILTVVWSK